MSSDVNNVEKLGTVDSVFLGFNVPETQTEVSHMEHEVNHQSYKQKGIPLLMFLLEEHVEMTEIYFMLLSLFLKNDTVCGN